MQHLCQVFGGHRSSYRAWRGRDRRPCETEQKMLDQVVEAHAVSNGSAGARSIAKNGHAGRNTVESLSGQQADEAVGADEFAAAKSRLQEG